MRQAGSPASGALFQAALEFACRGHRRGLCPSLPGLRESPAYGTFYFKTDWRVSRGAGLSVPESGKLQENYDGLVCLE